MITALLIGLVKTVLTLIVNIITGLFSSVFSDYSSLMSAISSSQAFKFAVGLMDIVFGSWSWFVQTTLILISIAFIVKLAKYLIGVLTKGGD